MLYFLATIGLALHCKQLAASSNISSHHLILRKKEVIKNVTDFHHVSLKFQSLPKCRASIFSIYFEIRIRIFSNPKLTNPILNPNPNKWVKIT